MVKRLLYATACGTYESIEGGVGIYWTLEDMCELEFKNCLKWSKEDIASIDELNVIELLRMVM